MKKSIDEKIEEDLKHCSLNGVKYSDYVKEHYISKDQYEARLKADLVAMLIDIQLEIDSLEDTSNKDSSQPLFYQGIGACENLIQEKINALKENKDD